MTQPKVLLINRENFLDWYFDPEMCKGFFKDQKVYEGLLRKGEFRITAQDLLDNVGYLPEGVVEKGETVTLNEAEEVDISAYDEVKFSIDYYNKK